MTRRQLLATAASATRVLGANDTIRIGAIGVGGRCRGLLDKLTQLPGNRIVATADVFAPARDLAWGTGRSKSRHPSRSTATIAACSTTRTSTPSLSARPTTGTWLCCATPSPRARMSTAKSRSPTAATTALPWWLPSKPANRWFRSVTSSAAPMFSSPASAPWPTACSARSPWRRRSGIRTISPAAASTAPPTRLNSIGRPGSAPLRPVLFELLRYARWRWFWDYGGGSITDLYSHWGDTLHWYFGLRQPSKVFAQGDRVELTEFECPDTLNASWLYPGLQVTYASTIIASLEGGGFVLRGTKAMMKITRSAVTVYPEGVIRQESAGYPDPILHEPSKRDGTIDHLENWLACIRSRNEPNAPVRAAVEIANASHAANRILRG
jgi:hypothetical protein